MELKENYMLVANWKMHKTIAMAKDFAEELFEYRDKFILCPAFTLLNAVSRMKLGGQDCSSYAESEGAFTGDISAAMLKDAGCEYVIIGHSERRKHHQESNHTIKNKIINAHKAGLIVILCIGESLTQREEGRYLEILAQQLKEALPDSSNQDNMVIAYEPIWAIGTGKTASIEQIEEVHQFLAKNRFKILYGGSVNIDNAKSILSINNVSGLLIGGASLDPKKFIELIKIVS